MVLGLLFRLLTLVVLIITFSVHLTVLQKKDNVKDKSIGAVYNLKKATNLSDEFNIPVIFAEKYPDCAKDITAVVSANLGNRDVIKILAVMSPWMSFMVYAWFINFLCYFYKKFYTLIHFILYFTMIYFVATSFFQIDVSSNQYYKQGTSLLNNTLKSQNIVIKTSIDLTFNAAKTGLGYLQAAISGILVR